MLLTWLHFKCARLDTIVHVHLASCAQGGLASRLMVSLLEMPCYLLHIRILQKLIPDNQIKAAFTLRSAVCPKGLCGHLQGVHDFSFIVQGDTDHSVKETGVCLHESQTRIAFAALYPTPCLHLDAPAPWAAQVVAGVPSSTFAAPLRYPIGEWMSPIGPAPMISTDSCAPVSSSSWRLTQ